MPGYQPGGGYGNEIATLPLPPFFPATDIIPLPTQEYRPLRRLV